MLRCLAALALICVLGGGCKIYGLQDLEMGVAPGRVIDKIPAVSPNTFKTVWYIDVMDGYGDVLRYPVTYQAFQAVDYDDMLPDDLRLPLPELERSRTPWR